METLKNQSIAEYAHIKTNLLSTSLTGALALNAIGITITVGLLDGNFNPFEKMAISVFVFSTATAIVLFFLVKNYLENLSYRFVLVDVEHMELMSKIAKRFYWPFLFGLICNILLAILGGVLLVTGFLI